MGKKLGGLIKAARMDAGFTQEQLARKIKGVSQADIGRYERGEDEPTQQVVKDIAKACGVTQKSLLDAMPKSKTSSGKTGKTSGSASGKTGKTGKTSSSSGKTGTSSANTVSLRVTSTEKRLVELYRAADSDTKKKALALLRGTTGDADGAFDVNDIIVGILENVLAKK